MRTSTFSVPFPGAKRPFEEGQKLHLWDFTEINETTRELEFSSINMLAAWTPAYENIVEAIYQRNLKVGILWTSSVGEMDLEPIEKQYLRKILDDPRINFVWFGDKTLAQLFPEKGFHLPYPFYTSNSEYSKDKLVKLQNKTKGGICFFGPQTKKKNILNSLIAVKLVPNNVYHVLYSHIPLHTDDTKLLRIDHAISMARVEMPWMDNAQYFDLIRNCRVNLAPSWCETFNYQVAESNLLGTPSIVSPTISLPGVNIVNPNDAISIGIILTGMLELNDEDYNSLQEQVYSETVKQLDDNNEIIGSFLSVNINKFCNQS